MTESEEYLPEGPGCDCFPEKEDIGLSGFGNFKPDLFDLNRIKFDHNKNSRRGNSSSGPATLNTNMKLNPKFSKTLELGTRLDTTIVDDIKKLFLRV